MEDKFKYIVYLTTNLVNNKIYIGVHKTKNPEVFDGYLGCGVKISDRSTYRYCHTPFESAVNKYGPSKFKRKTLKVFNKLEDALDLERRLVDSNFIKRKDTYNVTLGGNLPPTSKKIIYQYSLKGSFIKEWDSITEASIFYKCSSSSIGKAIFDRTPSRGYLWTDYKYEYIDINNFRINTNKHTCYIYDSLGNFINSTTSINEAAKLYNLSSGNISNAISGKYCVNKQYYFSSVKYTKFPIPEKISYDDGFYMYDLSGVFIRHFKTISEIQKFFNTKRVSSVYRAIRTGNTAFNYQWSNKKLQNMKELKVYNQKRKVGKYSLNDELLEVFDTVRSARKIASGVPQVLKGQRNTAGGYKWKYIE